MFTPEEFASVFSYEGISVAKPSASLLEEKVPDRRVREMLARYGLPRQLGDDLFFRDLGRECRTLGEDIRDDDRVVQAGVDGFLFLGAGVQAGIVVLDGSAGSVFSWKEGTCTPLNEHLGGFLEFICRIQAKVNEFEEGEVEIAEDDYPKFVADFLDDLRGVDSTAPLKSGEYWDEMVRAVI
ncbi:SUKH-4 family immunity protein [Streptomyces sp. NPDC126499]|uniref:SUKH-4 family immunity protein n=1 Tax=Streptomyces sp. NPDC126499 TaxID=3155314 RepID=UPI0033201957